VYSLLPAHPNLAQLVETKWDNLYHYLITELVAGGDLQKYTNRYMATHGKTLPEADVRHLFRQMCLGVSAMHAEGICHLDVSLENALVDTNQTVKLVDFGQARPFLTDRFGNSLSFQGMRHQYHTKDYCCPPEILLGLDVHGDKADSFALASCLYTMLMGRRWSHHVMAPYNPDYHNVCFGRIAYHARRQCGCVTCKALQRQADAAGSVFGGASCRLSESAALLIGSLASASPKSRASVTEALQSAFLNP